MSPPSNKSVIDARWIALIVSTIVGLVLVELGLRQVYDRLPSIDGLRSTQYRIEQLVDLAGEADSSLCHEVRSFLSHRSRWVQPGSASGVHFAALDTLALTDGGKVMKRGSDGANAMDFWVSGDSLAFGLGVRPEETMGAHLADRFAVSQGGGVTYRNLAVPGAGYCTGVQRVAKALERHNPDVVLLVLSADDLEERLMLNVQGNLVALPDLVQDPAIRWAVNRSWFANLLWFRLMSVREAVRSQQGRFVGRSTRDEFRGAMAGLNEQIQDRGGRLVVALVDPPGLPMCTESQAQQRCEWLSEDMNTMAALLDEAGVSTADLRGRWAGQTTDIVQRERKVIELGRLAMHPSADGHGQLAAWLWPFVSDAR